MNIILGFLFFQGREFTPWEILKKRKLTSHDWNQWLAKMCRPNAKLYGNQGLIPTFTAWNFGTWMSSSRWPWIIQFILWVVIILIPNVSLRHHFHSHMVFREKVRHTRLSYVHGQGGLFEILCKCRLFKAGVACLFRVPDHRVTLLWLWIKKGFKNEYGLYALWNVVFQNFQWTVHWFRIYNAFEIITNRDQLVMYI